MKHSLALRAFLFAFLPVCLLLAGTFWLLSTLVDREVRRGVRQSLQTVQMSVERNRLMHEERSGRLLAIVAKNAALRSVLELARVSPGPASARTVEDQLAELTAAIECDFMTTTLDGGGPAVAAVVRTSAGVRGIDPRDLHGGGQILEHGPQLYAADTVQIDGYPHGLKGHEVPRSTRIVHAADAYDAMTSDRPYRQGMSHGDALAQLTQGAGTQFDPDIVRVMVALTDRGWRGMLPGRTAGLGNLARKVAAGAGSTVAVAGRRAAATRV